MTAPVAREGTAPAGPRSRRTTVALSAAVAAGALVALQQRVNGELKTELGDAVLTALISFGTGLVVLLALVAARPASRRAFAVVRRVPPWMLLGGLGGASVVAVGAAATPVIGVALLTVGLVAGQTSGALVVDRVGLGPGGVRAVTSPRVAGAVLCLVAVAISVTGETARAASPVLLVLVVVTGFLISVQQALNGRVRRATGDAAVATLVNFVVGTTALAAALLLTSLVAGLDVGTWPGPDRWYLYTGGPMGATFIAVAALVVHRLGVLRLGLAVIAGQLVGALVLDLTLPVTGDPVGALTVLGVALTLVAVAVSGRAARSENRS